MKLDQFDRKALKNFSTLFGACVLLRSDAGIIDIGGGLYQAPLSATKLVLKVIDDALEEKSRTSEVFEIDKDDSDMFKFLDGIDACVEATDEEKQMLWERNTQWNINRTWVSNNEGRLRTIGYFGGMPVFISLWTAVIDGKKILFYNSPSTVVNYDMVREWLDKALTKSVIHTDAANFGNVFWG